MKNIYEYGSDLIQEESNSIINNYDLLTNELIALNMYDNKNDNLYRKQKRGSKVIGAMVAELFRKNIDYILKKNKLDDKYKVSENNVYVKGCHIEFDFLILKKSAKKVSVEDANNMEIIYELPIYDPMDVVAVLESKTYGIYTLYKGRDDDKSTSIEIDKNSLYLFVDAYNDLLKYNSDIKLGYMCLAEQRPKKDGGSNFIERTIYFFEDYFTVNSEVNCKDAEVGTTKMWFVYFAKCHFANKYTSDLFAEEGEWEKFVLNLVK